MNLDPRRQQLVIKRMRRVMLQAIFNPSLQQQHHTGAALCRLYQGAKKDAPGQEVSVGNNDFTLRAVDSLQVGPLDVTAMAQIITHQKNNFRRVNALRPIRDKPPDFLATPAEDRKSVV